MNRSFAARLGAAALGSGLLLAWPASAGAPQLAALDRVEAGEWELRDTDSDAVRKLCVGNARELIQFRHRGVAGCSRFIVSDTPGAVTVNYSCPGGGHGRTTIGVVSPRSINLDTQGIAGGLPFQESYAARRIGACPRR